MLKRKNFRLLYHNTLSSQGFDKGTQYRSAIFTWNELHTKLAKASMAAFNASLREMSFPRHITTEVMENMTWWYAEPEHQQYVAKPGNRQYCSAEPTGVFHYFIFHHKLP